MNEFELFLRGRKMDAILPYPVHNISIFRGDNVFYLSPWRSYEMMCFPWDSEMVPNGHCMRFVYPIRHFVKQFRNCVHCTLEFEAFKSVLI